MILADKLNKLRTGSGLSQEQLAEKMGVSRQSISKWESGASIPTMDKIVELSNIFGISTDYLLKDEIEEIPNEIVADLEENIAVRKVGLEDANDYVSKIYRVRNRIALGVMLCILSPVCLMVMLGASEMPNAFMDEYIATGAGVGILILLVAAAVAIFILCSIDTNKYEFLEKEEFHLEYGVEGIISKAKEEYLPAYYKMIAIGVVLCVISPVPLIILSLNKDKRAADYLSIFGVAVLLALVSCGVFLIVRASILKGAYDRLLQSGDYTASKKKASKTMEIFSSAYWTILTAVYLSISFVTMRWEMSWIIWPVGSVLFAAIYVIVENIVVKNRTEKK